MKDKELRRALINGKIIGEVHSCEYPPYLRTNNLIQRIDDLERHVEMLRRYLGVVYKYIPEDYIALKDCSADKEEKIK